MSLMEVSPSMSGGGTKKPEAQLGTSISKPATAMIPSRCVRSEASVSFQTALKSNVRDTLFSSIASRN